jgi:hypothetical protein
MKFIDTNTNATYAIGKCKNNMPPKHFLITGEKKAVTIDGQPATLFIARERSIYVVILLGTDYLYAAQHAMFDGDTFTTFVKPAKVQPTEVAAARPDGAMTAPVAPAPQIKVIKRNK